MRISPYHGGMCRLMTVLVLLHCGMSAVAGGASRVPVAIASAAPNVSRIAAAVDRRYNGLRTMRADFSETTADILKRSGYRCAFTSQHGPVRSGMEPFSLPRVKVEGGEGLWLFRLLVHGGLDGWRWVDKILWRIQASGHG